MAENKEYDVFISYGHDNFAKLVSDIAADLEKRGYKTWIDNKTGFIDPADNYNIKIQDGLDKSHKMLLFLSVHSMRQDRQNEYGYCLNEIDYAKYKPMQIVSVMLEDVPPYLPIAAIRRIDLKSVIVNNEVDREDKYNEKLDEICDYLEKNITLLGQEESNTILSRLNPFAYEGNPKLCKDYYERKWLTDSYLDWVLNKPDSKLLCIMGSAGSGKTEFISHLCKIKSFVSAVHFCRYNTNRNNSKRIIMSLAYYLATQIPEYEKKLEKAVDEEHKNLAASSFDYLFNLLFEEPLNEIKNPGQKIIIIDAVDEATTSTGENDLLNSIVSRLDKLPDWLRLVITTRPEQKIEKTIKNIANFKCDIIDIDSNPENNENDLRGFIAQGLSKKFEKLQASEQSNIINSLLEKVNGNFVYASYIVKDCLKQEGSLSEIIKNLPKGLDGYYELHLKRLFETTYICDTCKQNIIIRPKLANQDCIVEDCEICGKKTIHKELKTNKIVHSYESCKPILVLIAAQYEPLTWKQMFNILNTNGSLQENIFKSQISQLTSLFVMRDECLMPPHKSLFDWLSKGGLGDNFILDIENGHKKIADYYYNKYKNNVLDDYGIKHLTHHFLESNNVDVAIEILNSGALQKKRIELLGADLALKQYFDEIYCIFNKNNEKAKEIIKGATFLDIFGEYRKIISENNLYANLSKMKLGAIVVDEIGLDNISLKVEISLGYYYMSYGNYSTALSVFSLLKSKKMHDENSPNFNLTLNAEKNNMIALLFFHLCFFDYAEEYAKNVVSPYAGIHLNGVDDYYELIRAYILLGDLEIYGTNNNISNYYKKALEIIWDAKKIITSSDDKKMFMKLELLIKTQLLYTKISSINGTIFDVNYCDLPYFNKELTALINEYENLKFYNQGYIKCLCMKMLLNIFQTKYDLVQDNYKRIILLNPSTENHIFLEFLYSLSCYLQSNIEEAKKHIQLSLDDMSLFGHLLALTKICVLDLTINDKFSEQNIFDWFSKLRLRIFGPSAFNDLIKFKIVAIAKHIYKIINRFKTMSIKN